MSAPALASLLLGVLVVAGTVYCLACSYVEWRAEQRRRWRRHR